jgi:two-component system chemotaxis response regulator CheB
MPEAFTAAFAARLATRSALRVEESKEGTIMRPGLVVLARGGRNTELVRSLDAVRLSLNGRPRPEVHVPSLDVAAISAAELYHSATCLVVLTGMGNDGLRGARAVRERGGLVLTQSEDSCVIYGMPRAVVTEGLATYTLPIDRMAKTLVRLVSS